MISTRLIVDELNYQLACTRYRLSPGRFNASPSPILVNSSQKTGTTWMQFMLACIPGYIRELNYEGQISRYRTTLPGRVLHGHDPYSPELADLLEERGIKVVLMVRDPRDQTVSRMFHIRRVTSHPWHDRFVQLNDEEALLTCIEGREDQKFPGSAYFIGVTRSWFDSRLPVQRVRYEELLADPLKEMRVVLAFLDMAVPEWLLRAIVTRNQFERSTVQRALWRRARKPGEADPNSHFRKGISGDWKNHFKPIHIARFKEAAGQALIELGYEQDLDWS